MKTAELCKIMIGLYSGSLLYASCRAMQLYKLLTPRWRSQTCEVREQWLDSSAATHPRSSLEFHLHYTHTHIHTHLMALCPGLPGWAGTRNVKPIWILLKQEIVSGSGISWAVCKSALRSRQTAMPAVFLQARCPSCHPTNSVKALMEVLN